METCSTQGGGVKHGMKNGMKNGMKQGEVVTWESRGSWVFQVIEIPVVVTVVSSSSRMRAETGARSRDRGSSSSSSRTGRTGGQEGDLAIMGENPD